MRITDRIINYMEDLTYEDLSDSLIHTTKLRILDTLGTIIAGSSTPGCKNLIKRIQSWGGAKESTIAVYNTKVPVHFAALANCTMARVREMDDVHEKAGTHASAQIVPSAFCIAEYAKSRHDRIITGKEFILAVAMGTDIVIRLRKAGREDGSEIGWLGETFTPLAVALMGAKLLDFSKEMTRNALGIGYAQCSCNAQANVDGAFTVPLQQGLGAQAGILSLTLAEEGLTGAKEPFEGKYGFYSLYMRGNFNEDVLFADLGKKFEGSNISTKFLPCCQGNHAAIVGALQLLEKYKIHSEDIKKIIIRTNSFFSNILATPDKIQPKTSNDAQFSLYYTVACAIESGALKIGDFTGNKIHDEEIIKTAMKIRVVADIEKDTINELIPPVDLEIHLINEKVYKTTVGYVKGHPKDPGTEKDYIEKFEDCLTFSEKPLRKENIEKLLSKMRNIQSVEDVTSIVKYISEVDE